MSWTIFNSRTICCGATGSVRTFVDAYHSKRFHYSYSICGETKLSGAFLSLGFPLALSSAA